MASTKLGMCFAGIALLCSIATAEDDKAPAPGVMVFDAENNALGTVVGLYSSSPPAASFLTPDGVIIFSKGYFVELGFNGLFPEAFNISMYWTGDGCSGVPYLNDPYGTDGRPIGNKVVVFSGQANALFVPAGSGVRATSVRLTGVSMSAEGLANSNQVDPEEATQCVPVITRPDAPTAGWLLAPFDIRTLGWSVSGKPLHVAQPIRFGNSIDPTKPVAAQPALVPQREALAIDKKKDTRQPENAAPTHRSAQTA